MNSLDAANHYIYKLPKIINCIVNRLQNFEKDPKFQRIDPTARLNQINFSNLLCHPIRALSVAKVFFTSAPYQLSRTLT